ncbi:Flp pilus assembly protein CpaB [Paenibacillus sp.]|uniref:Flp pilus assembly protein CpaB n=1 Tax=Paenibacillus sp. TaxID=58172 RepID=UPI002D6A217C|nr:Flp pilus assembly protein CpaB [Paenibacillus sp.]HZG85514.1 Flp pilus assembly protein CpaB [Paenibacillus sp.]
MNPRRIWLWSALFGLAAALLLYQLLVPETTSPPIAAEEPAGDDAQQPPAAEAPKLLPIAEGMRAVSFPVDPSQGVNGFIRPGDYVDLVAVAPGADGAQSGSLLLTNARVLAVDQRTEAGDEPGTYSILTVEVSPEQGVRLAQALRQGSIAAMLRGTP